MNELKINGFSAVAEEEMMAVDGGGWIAALCASVGYTIGGYPGAIIGAIVGTLIEKNI
mgnify:FL=1